MYRATTPLHTFQFDVNAASLFQTILITYAQCGRVILEKGKEDLTFTTATVDDATVYRASFRLTQEEANLFDSSKPVKVQVRALTENDEAMASKVVSIHVHDVLNDEVLT